MKHTSTPAKFGNQQRGFALLAALFLIIIMTVIGFRIAEQGKDNAKMTGASVRYNQVFEAGELTLRKAMLFIQSIRGGEPLSTQDPSPNYSTNSGSTDEESIKNQAAHAAIFQNFDVGNVSELMTAATNYSFIWDGGALSKRICQQGGGENQCPEGVNFHKYLDFYVDRDGSHYTDIWQLAIKSSFAADEGIDSDSKNYLANIRTFTFIEKIEGSDESSKGGTGGSASEMNGSGGDIKTYYYRITVKASGFPPGLEEDKMISKNARENVLLQTVFAQVY